MTRYFVIYLFYIFASGIVLYFFVAWSHRRSTQRSITDEIRFALLWDQGMKRGLKCRSDAVADNPSVDWRE